METEKPAAPPFTNLQELLNQDSDGQHRRRILEELKTWQAELEQSVRAGLPPEEYKRAEALLCGVKAGHALLSADE